MNAQEIHQKGFVFMLVFLEPEIRLSLCKSNTLQHRYRNHFLPEMKKINVAFNCKQSSLIIIMFRTIQKKGPRKTTGQG